MRQIRFIFEDGKVEAEGAGFRGPACDVVIGKFLKALGGEVEERHHNLDYWESEQTQEQEQQAGNW